MTVTMYHCTSHWSLPVTCLSLEIPSLNWWNPMWCGMIENWKSISADPVLGCTILHHDPKTFCAIGAMAQWSKMLKAQHLANLSRILCQHHWDNTSLLHEHKQPDLHQDPQLSKWDVAVIVSSCARWMLVGITKLLITHKCEMWRLSCYTCQHNCFLGIHHVCHTRSEVIMQISQWIGHHQADSCTNFQWFKNEIKAGMGETICKDTADRLG